MAHFLWDQHTCLPLKVGADVDPLTRFQRRGGAFVSVNAGYSPHSFADTMALLTYYRSAVEEHPSLGWSELDIRAVLGENFHRVASQAWTSAV